MKSVKPTAILIPTHTPEFTSGLDEFVSICKSGEAPPVFCGHESDREMDNKGINCNRITLEEPVVLQPGHTAFKGMFKTNDSNIADCAIVSPVVVPGDADAVGLGFVIDMCGLRFGAFPYTKAIPMVGPLSLYIGDGYSALQSVGSEPTVGHLSALEQVTAGRYQGWQSIALTNLGPTTTKKNQALDEKFTSVNGPNIFWPSDGDEYNLAGSRSMIPLKWHRRAAQDAVRGLFVKCGDSGLPIEAVPDKAPPQPNAQ
jgi:hypothetical protein